MQRQSNKQFSDVPWYNLKKKTGKSTKEVRTFRKTSSSTFDEPSSSSSQQNKKNAVSHFTVMSEPDATIIKQPFCGYKTTANGLNYTYDAAHATRKSEPDATIKQPFCGYKTPANGLNYTYDAAHFTRMSEPEMTIRQPLSGYQTTVNRLNDTYDVAQHRKILQMLSSSSVQVTTWSCKQCLYANNALHVNTCEYCKSTRFLPPVMNNSSQGSVLLSENLKNKAHNGQTSMAALDNIEENSGQRTKDVNTLLEDQSWTCKTCTLVNNGDSLTCEACCTSKLHSLSISDETILAKEFWSCPLCTLKNSSKLSECDVCRTSKASQNRSRRRGKKAATAKVNSNCKTKIGGTKKEQNKTDYKEGATVRDYNEQKHQISDVEINVLNSSENFLENFQPWSCVICKFENSGSELICDMCKNMRNNLCDTDQRMELSKEEIAELQWNYIVSNCKIQNKLYVDETFPAVPDSLYYSPDDHIDQDLKWTRLRNTAVDKIDEHLPWVVFRDLLEASDVCQGEVGDCWLISALSVLVEREDLVRAIVLTKHPCPQGAYQVRLCKDGNWTVVTIDDIFPCDKEDNLLYSLAIRKQLWVPLIEKAMAKINSCYEALTTGSITEGLAALTGAPCENISLQPICASEIVDADLIWAQLVSSRQALFLMGTVCGGINVKIEEAEIEEKGLHPCHVYSILDVQCIYGHRLLQLRDPYGDFEWTGKWSYYSSNWTPQLQLRLLPNGPENGVFWIDFSEILKYFSSIGICRVRNGWKEMRLSGVLPPLVSQQQLSCVLLTIEEPTEVDLILYQNSQRETEISKRTQVDISVVLLKATGDSPFTYNLVANSKRLIQGFVGCYKMLEPAQYIVIPLAFNHWHTELPAELHPRYVLAIHSSKKLLAEQVTSSPETLADTIIAWALSHGEPQELLKHFTVYYLAKKFSGAAIVVENQYKNKWVHLKCDGDKESQNVVSTRGIKTTVDSIPPLHRQVIAVFTHHKASEEFFTAHQLDYRLANSSKLGDWGTTGASHVPNINYETDRLHIPRLIQES